MENPFDGLTAYFGGKIEGFERRAMQRQLRPGWHLTLEGRKFLLLTLLITIASVNTGNNLITLILSMLMSIVVVAVAMLAVNMGGLVISARVEGDVYAGQRASLVLGVTNGKRRFDSYSLRVVLPEGMEGEGYIPYVRAGQSVAHEVEAVFGRRGVHRLDELRVQSGFPFIFLVRTIAVRVQAEVVVYPELLDIERLRMGSGSEGGASSHSIRAGAGEDILGLRDKREGDGINIISWRASARLGRLIVREMAEDEPMTVTVVLDDVSPEAPEADFERAVSVAATIARDFLTIGMFVKFVTCQKVLPSGAGPEQLARVMYLLASVGPSEPGAPCLAGEEAKGYTILVLTGGQSAMAALAGEVGEVINAANV